MDYEEIKRFSNEKAKRLKKEQTKTIEEISDYLMNAKVKELSTLMHITIKLEKQETGKNKGLLASAFFASLIVGSVDNTDEALLIVNEIKDLITEMETDYNKS